MKEMTIRLPEDVAKRLEQVAMAQQKSMEQVAVERLRSVLENPASPQSLLSTIRALPHPSRVAVEDLEAAIVAGRLPVRQSNAFDH
jgi:hypothetical protein